MYIHNISTGKVSSPPLPLPPPPPPPHTLPPPPPTTTTTAAATTTTTTTTTTVRNPATIFGLLVLFVYLSHCPNLHLVFFSFLTSKKCKHDTMNKMTSKHT